MKAEDLKNYGKSWIGAMNSAPKGVMRGIRSTSLRILTKRIGISKLPLFAYTFLRERKRMSRMDLSFLAERGLTDSGFIRSQIEASALYSALRSVVGEEGSLDILYRVVEATAADLFDAFFPGMDAFRACDDPWDDYKTYMIATAEADKRDGAHVFEIVENSDSAFQLNCVYCAWFETAKALGVPDACLMNCHGDDVFMPEALRPVGILFKRESTLARGADCCDFRFEREDEEVDPRVQAQSPGQP